MTGVETPKRRPTRIPFGGLEVKILKLRKEDASRKDRIKGRRTQ